MAEHGNVELSALGLAVSNMVTVSEILKKEGWAVEKRPFVHRPVDFDRLYAENPPPPRVQRPPAAAAEVAVA
ncbi:hypothetical protein GPECTOR_8g311 [Gonium pectorale]|uniref:DNA/RNA-binding protein Alba-like domain-containing protein n=1 Tax=Gonium pectorale TaxID=33097 RepID=A0A150GSV6_GONPE|nr:hypothetical protein GPECTOR_8g311 [Gonium pectorale]|eukprot:KXZ52936.1 hypothetical protein GPECTOR_8g311 [Gonium pectorale]